ncbi:MAG: non-canonical purine NTP pyrophosphatase [Candidatus Nealsonbacteria bacterium]|nr:non-canonical purine NTP pyrophosphatase [Candidatus Nealsonbacteria bacterium]
MKKLLIATGNQGKIREYKEIFKQLKLPIKLTSLKELGIKEKAKETGKTFRENAIIKAKLFSKLSNLPTLSDDAGIEIDYLKGEPGVKSRRWLGYELTDEEIINIALKKLEGVPKKKRSARLRAVIGLNFPPSKKIYTFEGALKGFIAEKPISKRLKGYPFRSIFIPFGDKKYLGQLNIVAHRKKAVEKSLPIIKKYLC